MMYPICWTTVPVRTTKCLWTAQSPLRLLLRVRVVAALDERLATQYQIGPMDLDLGLSVQRPEAYHGRRGYSLEVTTHGRQDGRERRGRSNNRRSPG
jgi:hypothetical protein